MYQSRQSANRGRGGGKRPFDNRKPEPRFSLDCYCIYCGQLIANQALGKDIMCPNPNCKMPIPARTVPSNRSGWIHCRYCDRFTHPAYYFCMNCGNEGGDGKAGFVLAKRTLMSRRPELVAEGKNVSLRELGGEQLLGTPAKKLITTRVVVYPKKSDGFDAAGDQLLGQVELDSIQSTTEAGVSAGGSKESPIPDGAEICSASKKQKADDGSSTNACVEKCMPAADKDTAQEGGGEDGAETDSR